MTLRSPPGAAVQLPSSMYVGYTTQLHSSISSQNVLKGPDLDVEADVSRWKERQRALGRRASVCAFALAFKC